MNFKDISKSIDDGWTVFIFVGAGICILIGSPFLIVLYLLGRLSKNLNGYKEIKNGVS